MRHFDLFDHDTIPLAALGQQAQQSQAVHLDPDAYLAAFLNFQNLLPDHVDASQPADVQHAVAWQLAHPEPVASYEYMQAFVNLTLAHVTVQNLSLTAIDHISPDVSAYTLAQLVAPVQPGIWH